MENHLPFSKTIINKLTKKEYKSCEGFISQSDLANTSNAAISLIITYAIDKEFYANKLFPQLSIRSDVKEYIEENKLINESNAPSQNLVNLAIQYSFNNLDDYLLRLILKKYNYECSKDILYKIITTNFWRTLKSILKFKITLNLELQNSLFEEYPRNEDSVGIDMAHIIVFIHLSSLEDVYYSMVVKAMTKFHSWQMIDELLYIGKTQIAENLILHNAVYNDCLLAKALEYSRYSFVMLFMKLYSDTLEDISELEELLLANIQEKFAHLELYLFLIRRLLSKFSHEFINELIDYFDSSVHSDEKDMLFLLYQANPIKTVILIVELISMISQQENSLKYKCDSLLEDYVKLAVGLQDQVEDEKSMTEIFFDKDISNRLLTDIIGNTMYLPLFKNQTMMKVTNDIWTGPYETDGNILTTTSNLWKLVTCPFSGKKDFEQHQRKITFKRDAKGLKNHSYQFITWREGLHFRYLLDFLVYLAISIFLFYLFYLPLHQQKLIETTKEEMLSLIIEAKRANLTLYGGGGKPPIRKLEEYFTDAEVESLLNNDTKYELYLEYKSNISTCNVNTGNNITFLLEAYNIFLALGPYYALLIIYLMLTRKSPTNAISDFVLDILILGFAIFSAAYEMPIFLKLDFTADSSAVYEVSATIAAALSTSFYNIYGTVALFLVTLRLLYMMRVSTLIGPFIRIMIMIFKTTFPFLVMYFVTLFIFSLMISILLYSSQEDEFSSLYRALIFLFNSSLNNYDIAVIKGYKAGEIFQLIYVVITSIIFMNMIIAILGNTFGEMQQKSKEINLEEIVKLRSFYAGDENYGAVISSFFPLNIVFGLVSLIILVIVKRKYKPKVNKSLLYIEYLCLFGPVLGVYIILELIVLPISYIKILIQKFILLFIGIESPCSRFVQFILYLAFGIFFLLYTMISDIGYFTIKCFSEKAQLKNEPSKNDCIEKEYYDQMIKFMENELIIHKNVKLKIALKKVEDLSHLPTVGISKRRLSTIRVDKIAIVPQPKVAPLKMNDGEITALGLASPSIQVLCTNSIIKNDNQTMWNFKTFTMILKNLKIINQDGIEIVHIPLILSLLRANEELEVIRAKIKILDSKSKKDLINQSVKSLAKSVVSVGKPNILEEEVDESNGPLIIMKRLLFHKIEKVRTAVAYFKNSNLLPLKIDKICNGVDKILSILSNGSYQDDSKPTAGDLFSLLDRKASALKSSMLSPHENQPNGNTIHDNDKNFN